MRVLVTGSRNWTQVEPVRTLLADVAKTDSILLSSDSKLVSVEPNLLTLVAGGAHGADTICQQVGSELGYRVEVFQADWATYGKMAGNIRNTAMVMSGADLCLAFPLGISRGTRHCMEMATLKGIPVYEVQPRGDTFIVKLPNGKELDIVKLRADN